MRYAAVFIFRGKFCANFQQFIPVCGGSSGPVQLHGNDLGYNTLPARSAEMEAHIGCHYIVRLGR